jgi:hypothetical protein
MSFNVATKYESAVDEKFTKAAITPALTNKDFNWNGVKSIVVYSYGTTAMSDYTKSGTSRYGSPAELDNDTQTMTVSMDRAFTHTIDRANYNDSQMSAEVGKCVARQLNEVVIPEIDNYTFAKMVLNAGNSSTTAVTSSNAYSLLVAARKTCVNKKVPVAQLVCVASSTYYSKLILDTTNFIKAGDLAQSILITGQVGKCAGLPVVEVPDSYLNGAEFILVAPMATTVAMKIEELKIHDNPQGISGWLVEGRFNYDAFVRTNKKDAIFAQIAGFTTVSTAGVATKTILSTADIDLAIAIKAGFTLKYYAAAASGYTAKVYGDDCSGLSTYTLGSEIVITATHKIQLILCDAAGKAIVPGTAVVVVLGS